MYFICLVLIQVQGTSFETVTSLLSQKQLCVLDSTTALNPLIQPKFLCFTLVALHGDDPELVPQSMKRTRSLRCGAGGHVGSFSLTQVPVDLQAYPLLVLQQVVLYVGVELHRGGGVHEALAVHSLLVHQHHSEIRCGDVQSLPDQNTHFTH